MAIDLDMLAEGGRISVALATSRVAALVRLVDEVCACVLEAV